MSVENPKTTDAEVVPIEPEVIPRRVISRNEKIAALTIAIVADGLQLALGPLGWISVDPLIDVVAAILTIRLLGFHLLLLPTFVTEMIPMADLLPTWTGCVLALLALKKREGE